MKHLTSTHYKLEAMDIIFGLDVPLDRLEQKRIRKAIEIMRPVLDRIVETTGEVKATYLYQPPIAMRGEFNEDKLFFNTYAKVTKCLFQQGLDTDTSFYLVFHYQDGHNPPWRMNLNDPEVQKMIALGEKMKQEGFQADVSQVVGIEERESIAEYKECA